MGSAKTAGRQAMRPSTRRLIQLYSALLHNAHLKGFVEGEIYQGSAKYACLPGLNCYSCPGAVAACPLGALQNALASTGHRAAWYVVGILLLFGITLGRTICGWLCPLGFLQELLHKLPTVKIRKSRLTRALSLLKYAVLAVFVLAIPLWYGLLHDIPLPGFCKYLCPAGTLEGAVALLSHPGNADLFSMLGGLFTLKVLLLLCIVLACLFCYRSFCRFLCPLGALYGLFNRFCLVGVRVEQGRCNGCGACVRNCGMDIRSVGDRECIHCAACISGCAQNAISLRAGKARLIDPARPACAEDDKRRQKNGRIAWRIAWAIALSVLCAALVWFNFLDPAVQGGAQPPSVSSAQSEGTSGAQVGTQPEAFSVACLDGTTFSLAETRGKVVFLNLWATYCAPCLEELPYFDELYREHKEDVAVLAVHSSLVTDDPAAFLEGRDYAISFAVDTEDDRLWHIVGGSSTLPQTIVLNREGTVIYNQKGSVTRKMLAALYEKASKE